MTSNLETEENLLVFAQLYISNLVVSVFGKWFIQSNGVLFSTISKLSEPVPVFLHGRLTGYSVSFRPIASSKRRFSPCVLNMNKPGLFSALKRTAAGYQKQQKRGQPPALSVIRRSHPSAGLLTVDRPTALWDNESVRKSRMYEGYPTERC